MFVINITDIKDINMRIKNYILIIVTFTISMFLIEAQANSYTDNSSLNCLEQFGFDIIYDPYYQFKNRVFLINIYTNSPAEEANLKSGDEIIKINNTKINKLSLSDISEILTNQETVKLEIKSDATKRYINLSKSMLCTAEYTSNVSSYIEQIYKNDYEEVEKMVKYSLNISDKLSKEMKKQLQNQQRNTTYLLLGKNKFENDYNDCKTQYKNSIAQYNCIFSAVNNQIINMKALKPFFISPKKNIKTKL